MWEARKTGNENGKREKTKMMVTAVRRAKADAYESERAKPKKKERHHGEEEKIAIRVEGGGVLNIVL